MGSVIKGWVQFIEQAWRLLRRLEIFSSLVFIHLLLGFGLRLDGVPIDFFSVKEVYKI